EDILGQSLHQGVVDAHPNLAQSLVAGHHLSWIIHGLTSLQSRNGIPGVHRDRTVRSISIRIEVPDRELPIPASRTGEPVGRKRECVNLLEWHLPRRNPPSALNVPE